MSEQSKVRVSILNVYLYSTPLSLAVGCASKHVLSQSASPEIGRVATGRASSEKNTLGCMAELTLTPGFRNPGRYPKKPAVFLGKPT